MDPFPLTFQGTQLRLDPMLLSARQKSQLTILGLYTGPCSQGSVVIMDKLLLAV